MISYPNQKIVNIHKPKYTRDFIQIGKEDFNTAFKALTRGALGVYMYLAGNADDYNLALSQKDIENKLGLSKATYHRAIKELKEKGYIKVVQGNIERFCPSLTNDTNIKKEEVSQMRQESLMDDTSQSHGRDKEVSRMNREIYKIDNINKIDKTEKLKLEEKKTEVKEERKENYREAAVLARGLHFETAIPSIIQLLDKGFTAEWIETAIEHKGISYFNRSCTLGLLFKIEYQQEINNIIEERNRFQSQVALNIERAMAQREQQPTIVIRKQRKNKNRARWELIEDCEEALEM